MLGSAECGAAAGFQLNMGESKTWLRRRYEHTSQYLELLDNYLQQVAVEACHNVYMLSNQVLSRNLHASDLFRRLLFEEQADRTRKRDVIKKLAQYYYWSINQFISYVAIYFTQRLLASRIDSNDLDLSRELYVVDTFVLAEAMLRDQAYEERYFVGLYDDLNKYDKQFIVLPVFYGGNWLKPNLFLGLSRLLEHSDHRIITEFQLLRFSDILRAIRFIVCYPYHVLALKTRIVCERDIDRQFNSALVETLDQVTFHSFIRYLVGRRVGALTRQKIKLISWYENQVIDKNLYRGIRETSPSVLIYGCQFFVGHPLALNCSVAASDISLKLAPDCVLVNGKAYLRNDSSVEYRLGVSFRYRHIFSATVNWTNKSRCVIFLTYIDQLNNDIFRLCVGSATLKRQRIAVKRHPASPGCLSMKLPGEWGYTEQDVCELLDTAAIIVTSESGVAVEAAAMGVSVIIVASQSGFTCNPMLETGRGRIWDIVFDVHELETTYSKLLEYRADNISGIRELAEFYKGACFVEPTEENIVQAFDLCEKGVRS